MPLRHLPRTVVGGSPWLRSSRSSPLLAWFTSSARTGNDTVSVGASDPLPPTEFPEPGKTWSWAYGPGDRQTAVHTGGTTQDQYAADITALLES